jgi:hypothetical protein
MPDGRPGFMLELIAAEFGVEKFHDQQLDYADEVRMSDLFGIRRQQTVRVTVGRASEVERFEL